jgi:hypothetical protein
MPPMAQGPADSYDLENSSSSSGGKGDAPGTVQSNPALFWSPQQGVYFTYKYR